MCTIALIAQKGCTGKTTLAVHVAADFEGAGGLAALVDLAPPQASAALWGEKRASSRKKRLAALASRRPDVVGLALEGIERRRTGAWGRAGARIPGGAGGDGPWNPRP